jgi:NADH:ubiquinone oxidoreductase subunit 6 (subunit J)
MDLIKQLPTYIPHGIFGLLALVTLGGAVMVLLARRIVHAAFWLFPVFAGIAGLFLLLDAQFLAAIQVLIYIGAILVLFVFAVTLTRNIADADEHPWNPYVIPVALAALTLVGALGGAAFLQRWGTPVASVDAVHIAPGVAVTDVPAIGLALVQGYLLPFEIASVLLLAGMIGALVLARREKTPVGDADGMEAPAAAS